MRLPEPAPLPNLAPAPPSSQQTAAENAPPPPLPAAALPPVSVVNWEPIKRFRNRLQEECIETCVRCNEKWFQIGPHMRGDDIGVYKACIEDAKSLEDLTCPFLFSDTNELNLGPIPKHLPILTSVEEMLITRVYVHLQVMRVHGQ